MAEVHFNRERDEYTKGLEYLTVLELLSRCDSLVGSSCSAMLVAKEMNMGKYEYYEVFEDKLQILSASDWRVFLRHCVRYFNKTMNIHEYARPKK